MIEKTYNVKLKPGHAVAFDFDGVIHKYREGWKDGSIYDELNPEMITLMGMLQKMSIPVFIFSTRDSQQILDWWNDLGIKLKANLIGDNITFWNDIHVIGITRVKLPAQLYIDDRAYKYEGQSAKDLLISLSIEEEKNVF